MSGSEKVSGADNQRGSRGAALDPSETKRHPTLKHCNRCSTEKSLDEFHRDRGSRDGRTSYCKVCQCRKMRAYTATNGDMVRAKDRERRKEPERSRRTKDQRLQKKYGITIEQYEALLDAQGHTCAICGGPEPIQDGRVMPVDHNHKTGEVRGILCSSCNRALGLFGDSVERLETAVLYLRVEEIVRAF